MAIRDQLAQFCYGLKFEDLPRDIVVFAMLLIREQIGLTTATGSRDPEVKIIVDDIGIARFFKEIGGKEESSLLTEGCKVPCINAAFSNTAITFNRGGAMHRSTVHLEWLIPATIAVAERQGASGKDLILAAVIGFEIMARVGMALGASNVYNRGFHPTSLCAPIGCAAAASKILGLGQEATAEAISIAAVQGAGAPPWPQFPKNPHTNRIQAGRAAQSGVLAALLAQMGVVGISDIFENSRGFLTAHSAEPAPTKLTEGLGTVYQMKQSTLKRFSVGIYLRPAVEALLELLQKNQIRAEDIQRMICKLPTAVVPLVGSSGYPSGAAVGAASKSTRYVLAFTAYKGEEGILFGSDEFKSEANLRDPRHIELFKLIDVVAEPELDKFFPGTWPCILILRTKDGREFSQFHNGSIKGSPENPFTLPEMEARFNKVIAPLLRKQGLDQMLEVLSRLEEVDDVSGLAGLMAARLM